MVASVGNGALLSSMTAERRQGAVRAANDTYATPSVALSLSVRRSKVFS